MGSHSATLHGNKRCCDARRHFGKHCYLFVCLDNSIWDIVCIDWFLLLEKDDEMINDERYIPLLILHSVVRHGLPSGIGIVTMGHLRQV